MPFQIRRILSNAGVPRPVEYDARVLLCESVYRCQPCAIEDALVYIVCGDASAVFVDVTETTRKSRHRGRDLRRGLA